MKKIRIKLYFKSGKKFYEEDYKEVYECRSATEKYGVKKFRKKYPNAKIYDVFSNSGYDDIAGFVPIGNYYVAWVRGYFYLSSKTNYKLAIKKGKIKRK